MSKFTVTAITAILLSSVALGAVPITFNDVQVRFCKDKAKCYLGEKDASLVFDNDAQEIRILSTDQPASYRYSEIDKIVFDVTQHMRGGLAAALVGGFVGGAIANGAVSDYWLYIQDHKGAYSVVEIPDKYAMQVISTARKVLEDKVTIFPTLQGSNMKAKQVQADLKAKHRIKFHKSEHPLPEPKAGKALIVVACPLIGQFSPFQHKLYANEELLTINMGGTYSFAYVDPGEYLFLSKGHENNSGVKVKVEPGQGYYFLQNQAKSNRQSLSLQSPEIVLHEITGLHWTEWSKK